MPAGQSAPWTADQVKEILEKIGRYDLNVMIGPGFVQVEFRHKVIREIKPTVVHIPFESWVKVAAMGLADVHTRVAQVPEVVGANGVT